MLDLTHISLHNLFILLRTAEWKAFWSMLINVRQILIHFLLFALNLDWIMYLQGGSLILLCSTLSSNVLTSLILRDNLTQNSPSNLQRKYYPSWCVRYFMFLCFVDYLNSLLNKTDPSPILHTEYLLRHYGKICKSTYNLVDCATIGNYVHLWKITRV